ncbi:tetratricopeptide repeat protein [Luteolibacter pohnpeiensis]|uniref:tetratricopeptide repeat protein n=1 Tax=Luteolibacter pohnpeiensis TaxID=454153 RepID=UPI0019066407|nr:tetratricopeptide repeat protein [Luteolibacter pohnpeiensis]
MAAQVLAALILSAAPLAAQAPPRAVPVEPDQALQPNAAEDFYQRGKNLYDAAQARPDQQSRAAALQRAADIFSQYLSTFPDDSNAELAWFYLGSCYYQTGMVEDAKRCFHTVLNRYGTGVAVGAAAYTLAADHYHKGEYAFAAPLFEKYAENPSKPEDRPRGNTYAGRCYRLLGRDSDALTSFRKVIDDPAGGLFAPEAKVAVAQILLKKNKADDALKMFEAIINSPTYLAKTRGEAALGASQAATLLKKPDLADKYLQLIMSTPGMEDFVADAQVTLMRNRFEEKKFKEVVQLFSRSSQAAEGEKEAARLMIAAKSYMELKNPTRALELFRQIETIVPPESNLAFEASYYRIYCFFQIEGHHVPEQVDAFLEIYQDSRPNDRKVQTALLIKAESLYDSGQAEEAAKVYPKIKAEYLLPENQAGLYYQRGWCLAEAGDQEGAIRSLTDFIEKYPKDSRVRSAVAKRAMAHVALGQSAKAIIDFDQITAAGIKDEYASMAWLESARLRRSENNINDMVLRYKGLLGNVDNLSDKLLAEANYWIGWGLFKQDAKDKSEGRKESVAYLEKARKLDFATYRAHAGILLAFCHYVLQQPDALADEINLAVDGKYESDIPDQVIQWAAMQAFNAHQYASAARFLKLVSNSDEPRETPKEVWRYLAKAELEIEDGKTALEAANNVLNVEEDPAWKADALVDKARALYLLNQPVDARKVADEADQMRPQGRTKEQLLLLSGDLFVKAGDFTQAASNFLTLVSFHEDSDLRPLALFKLAATQDKLGDAAAAQKYRDQLKEQYPDWKAP